jgi:hypothetical protein
MDSCERHAGNTVVQRCAHLGNRYVSEMRWPPTRTAGFMDYVNDDPDNWYLEGYYFDNACHAENLWKALNERMQSGDPPVNES